jgi:hypothetical protein
MCLEDTEAEVIQRYTWAYLWYVFNRVLFSEGMGKNAAYMWLKLFVGWEQNLS